MSKRIQSDLELGRVSYFNLRATFLHITKEVNTLDSLWNKSLS